MKNEQIRKYHSPELRFVGHVFGESLEWRERILYHAACLPLSGRQPRGLAEESLTLHTTNSFADQRGSEMS